MKTAAYGLSFISVVIAIMYYMLPGGSLPTFFPGYVARSTHIHFMHGVAATAGAVVGYGGNYKSARGGPSSDATAKMILRELVKKREGDLK